MSLHLYSFIQRPNMITHAIIRYKREMANYKPPPADDDDGFIVEDEEEAVVE